MWVESTNCPTHFCLTWLAETFPSNSIESDQNIVTWKLKLVKNGFKDRKYDPQTSKYIQTTGARRSKPRPAIAVVELLCTSVIGTMTATCVGLVAHMLQQYTSHLIETFRGEAVTVSGKIAHNIKASKLPQTTSYLLTYLVKSSRFFKTTLTVRSGWQYRQNMGLKL